MTASPKSDEPRGLLDEPEEAGETTVLSADEPSSTMRLEMLGRVGPAMAVVLLCVVAAFVVPQLEFARPYAAGDPVPFWNLLGRGGDTAVSEERTQELAKVDAIAREAVAAAEEGPQIEARAPVLAADVGAGAAPYVAHPDDELEVERPLELFEGHELDRFFESLARTEAGEAHVTAVAHYGDSAISIDGIPGAIRARMQARFGDGGHGFHLMAQPNTSYIHQGVKFRDNGKWGKCFIIYRCRDDGHYGLGGATFQSVGGAESFFAPNPEKSSGQVSRYRLFYAKTEGGGDLRVRIDTKERKGESVVVPTAGDALEDAFFQIAAPKEPHELSVRAAGGGRVRIYGVTLELDGPGVAWDSLALVGAFAKRMLGFNKEHLARQLDARSTSLVVVMFGGNDLQRNVTRKKFVEEFTAVLGLLRAARPEMDCVVMAPLDHGRRVGQRIESVPAVEKLVAAQREAARQSGCAFYDTFSAMGGKGSAGRWHKRKPRLIAGDLGHVTRAGQVVVGEMFYRALMQAYVAHRKATG